MLKIAIFTIIGRGPGTKLQNYALQTFLENKFGANVETIKRKGYFYEKISMKNFFKYLTLKEIIKFFINYKGYRDFLLRERKVQDAWLSFDKNIHFTKDIVKTNDGPIGLSFNHKYNYFIVGSDQVWNPLWYPDIDFFKDIPHQKTIAYAASFGVYSLPEKVKSVFKRVISSMGSVSVRETAGADIIQDLIHKKVPVVIDPTLLLGRDVWMKIAQRPKWYCDSKYILAFFLGTISLERKKQIDLLAKQNNCKVIYALDYSNFEWAQIGPAEFVYLINQSEGVLTDSFHGSVFSIIMHKPFFAFDRLQNNLCNMNSRLDTLLALFDFVNRHIENDKILQQQDLYNITFENVDFILKREQGKAESYLRKAMHLD